MDKYTEIHELFCIENPLGYTAEEVERAKVKVGGLPRELEQFYLKYGKSPELHDLQDELILAGEYEALLHPDYIIFFNENQGVCQAAVKKSDVNLPDPPVYTSVDDGEWQESCPRVSDFLIAMFGYQASICLEYNPEEFFFITPEEKDKIERLFKKREQSFDNWLYDWSVTLYGDNNEGRIAVMTNGGDIQMNYAANTEEEFLRIKEMLGEIGEAM